MSASVAEAELPRLLGADGNANNQYAESELIALTDMATDDTTTLTVANDSNPPVLVGSA